MAADTTTELATVHEFVARQLDLGRGSLSPEEVLALWREHEATVVAVREGLRAVDMGRTQPLEEFVEDFQDRHRLSEGA